MLKIESGGYTFVAKYEEEAAPKTIEAFRARLLKGTTWNSQIVQVRWSGEAGWIPLGDFDLGVDYENATAYPHPGELLFFPGGPGAVSESELLIGCGRTDFASKAGRLAGNHFATIVEGLENIFDLHKKFWWEGAQDISFTEI